jgi:hypothetical protein
MWRAGCSPNAAAASVCAWSGVDSSNHFASVSSSARRPGSGPPPEVARLTVASSVPMARAVASRSAVTCEGRPGRSTNQSVSSRQSAAARPRARSAQQVTGGACELVAGQHLGDGRRVAQHVLDDHLDVLNEQVPEAGDLVGGQVVAGDDLPEVGVEVADGRGQLAVLQEQRGDLLRHPLDGLGRGVRARVAGVLVAGAGQPDEQLVETRGDRGQQFARDLAGALGGAQQLVDVALDAHAELADLVADAAVLELGDRGGHDLAPPRDQVAPLDELFEARDHVLDAGLARRDVAAALCGAQRGRHLAGRQVREQRRREQPHDPQVGAPVLARVQVGVELEPAGLVRRQVGCRFR